MKHSKKIKQLGRTLFDLDKSTREISEQCKISQRTAQRWVKEFEKLPRINKEERQTQPKSVAQAAMATMATMATIPAESTPQAPPLETLDLSAITRMPARLLDLTNEAIATLENCLHDPDSRYLDKLKAIQILATWMGFEAKYPVGLNRLFRMFDVTVEDVNIDTATVTLAPKSVAQAKKAKEEAKEEAQKRERAKRSRSSIHS